jgi:hypothetical protein
MGYSHMKQKRKSWGAFPTGGLATSYRLKAVMLIFCFFVITFSFLRRKEVKVGVRMEGYS